jgi:hypothetical protein
VPFPNPYNPSKGQPLNLSVNVLQDYKKATLRIYTTGYRMVKQIVLIDEPIPTGTRIFSISAWKISNLAAGSYYYQVEILTAANTVIKSKASLLMILK